MSYITKEAEVGANIRTAINERGMKQRFVDLGKIAEVLNVTVDKLLKATE